MGGLKPLLVGILISGLFAVALISAGILLASHNGANQSIGDDPILLNYKTNMETQLEKAHTNANSSLEALGGSPVTESGGAFIYDATTGTWKTLKEVPSAVYNLNSEVVRIKILGDGFNVALAIVAAILIIVIIFGVIKLVISGQDE